MARIVFDLDGTLIDSAPDICGIANGLLASRGLEPITIEQARDFVGNGPSVFIEKMRTARGIEATEHRALLQAFLGSYEDAVTLTEVYPGVVNALETLRDEGHKLGICTNKPLKPCLAVLTHLKIDGFFETVFGGDSLPVHKPDPAPLNAAFDALGAGEKVFVGDSGVDAATAVAARVPFLLYTEGYRKQAVTELPHDGAFSHFDAFVPLLADVFKTRADRG